MVSGDAPVSPYAATSHHRFDQEVEAALVLQAQIDYPVIDDNAANLGVFIPFEDGPGSTVFDNLISYPNPNNIDPDVEASVAIAAPGVATEALEKRAKSVAAAAASAWLK